MELWVCNGVYLFKWGVSDDFFDVGYEFFLSNIDLVFVGEVFEEDLICLNMLLILNLFKLCIERCM